MKKTLLTLQALFFAVSVFAQNELTLPFMEHLYQSTYYNPAAIPDHKISVGIPVLSSVFVGVVNTGFSLSDIDSMPAGASKPVINLTKMANSLSASNYLSGGVSFDIFHLRFKTGNSFLSFNIRNVNNVYFSYPHDVGTLLTLNIADQTGKGKDIDLSDLSYNAYSYNEYALGLTKPIKKFTIGVRLKLLQGISSSKFDADNLIIKCVDPDMYSYAFSSTATMYTSVPNLDTAFKMNSNNASFSDYFNFKNIGFGADLGITYNPTTKLSFNLSVNNLGFINWANNAAQHVVQPNVTFSGLDLLGSYIRGESSNYNVGDSLKNQMQPKASYISSYSSALVPRTYLTAKYNFTPKFMLGGTVFMDFYKVPRMAFVLAAQYKIGNFISLTTTGSYQFSKLSWGGGIVLKPGPVQLYVVSDHLSSLFNPTESKAVNVRFGINLVFGKLYPAQKQAFEKE